MPLLIENASEIALNYSNMCRTYTIKTNSNALQYIHDADK
jgi:hypothetical protein